jgi:DNA primase
MNIQEGIRGIAERYLSKVKPSGPENIMAICPFHMGSNGQPEKHPSFAMSLTKGVYFCHSCQTSGSLRRFFEQMGVPPILIERLHKYTLQEAEEALGPPPDPLRPKVISSTPINDQLLGLFNYCPTSLQAAGFSQETLQTFEVGYDKWHNRVTYPMRDLKGQLVGINGRSLSDDNPRYKIYDKEYMVWGLPERVGWNKRTVLYNAHRVYPKAYLSSDPDPIVVVEGFKACMWLWQAGIKDVVALLGTYLSWEHRWILERLGAHVYLFLDNNQPGRYGAYKAAKALSQSLKVSLLLYPKRLEDVPEAQPDSCSETEIVEQYQQPVNWYLSQSRYEETTQERQ